jgi:hypothetical protein
MGDMGDLVFNSLLTFSEIKSSRFSAIGGSAFGGKVMHSMNAVRGRYNTLPLINTGAILFTIKLIENLLWGERETWG